MDHRISAVLFDFGLVLSGPPNPQAWQRMHQALAISADELHRRYWARRHDYDLGALSGEAFWQTMAADRGAASLSAETLDLLFAADIDLWTDINQPMLDWAQDLQRRGLRTGILSNMGDQMTAGLLRKFSWLLAFDHHTWSYALRLAKPQPAIYRHAVEGMETPAQQILFVDDKIENIIAAREAGMQAVQYTNWPDFLLAMQAAGFAELLGDVAPESARLDTREAVSSTRL